MGSISYSDHNSFRPWERSICGERHYPAWEELRPLEMRKELEEDWMRKICHARDEKRVSRWLGTFLRGQRKMQMWSLSAGWTAPS